MRRLAILAAFLLVVSLLPASAQRGGMRGGFGGHGGGMGHAFGGHGFGGGHFGGGFHFGGGTFDGFGRFGRFGFRGRGFHHHCWGCGFGYPGYGYGYAGFYDPFWWWGDTSSSYEDEQQQQALVANQMNLLSMQEQDLREREDWLRQREEQDSYARRPPAREEEHAVAPSPEPATVLVFRDQHRQEITNYAISSGTLWVLNDHLLAKKIPLADLDLVATTKANDERGVQFQVPK